MALYGMGPGTWYPAGCAPQPAAYCTPANTRAVGRGTVQRLRLARGPAPAALYPIPVRIGMWSVTQGLILKPGWHGFYGDLRLFGLPQNW